MTFFRGAREASMQSIVLSGGPPRLNFYQFLTSEAKNELGGGLLPLAALLPLNPDELPAVDGHQALPHENVELEFRAKHFITRKTICNLSLVSPRETIKLSSP